MYQSLNGMNIKYDIDCQKNDIYSGKKGFINYNGRILINNQAYKNDLKYSTLNQDLYCKQFENAPFRSNSSNNIFNPYHEKCISSILPHSSSYSNINRNNYNINDYKCNIDYNLNLNEGYNNLNKRIIENEKEIKINWKNINHLNQLNFDVLKINDNKNNRKYKKNYNLNKNLLLKSNNNFSDLNLLEKNLERKYELYNKITKYDELFSKINKNNYDNNKDDLDEKRIQKNNERKNKIHYKKKNIFNRNNKININYSLFEKSESSSSKILNNKNSKNKIQRAFTQIIGLNNNEHIFTIYKHDEKNFPLKGKNIYINDKENNNIDNNQDLLNYLKSENEKLKKINNTYKYCLDNLFYFLNKILYKFSQINNDDNIKLKNIPPYSWSELLDFSKCLNDANNIYYFSKKLIKLENIINENINKVKEFNYKKNKYKLITITKENSFFLPEKNQIINFNQIIESINEKGFSFSFKNENKEDENKINNLSNDDNNNKNKIDNNNNNNLDKYDKKEFVQIKTCNNFNKYDNLYKKINNEKNKK